ncbi:MAG: organic solvent tolerance protein [Bdellovibrio sp.]
MLRSGLFCIALISALVGFASAASAKDLSSRLGVGFRNAYSFDLPSLAAHYYPTSDMGFVGAVGIDTEDQNSKFALSGGIRKIIFTEDNLNFFMGGVFSMVSKEAAGSTDSGFELAALVGAEFFFAGLENLGFNFETGVAVTNVKKVRFRTMGDSFLRAGIVFYF